jgi:hypothetical protein
MPLKIASCKLLGKPARTLPTKEKREHKTG